MAVSHFWVYDYTSHVRWQKLKNLKPPLDMGSSFDLTRKWIYNRKVVSEWNIRPLPDHGRRPIHGEDCFPAESILLFSKWVFWDKCGFILSCVTSRFPHRTPVKGPPQTIHTATNLDWAAPKIHKCWWGNDAERCVTRIPLLITTMQGTVPTSDWVKLWWIGGNLMSPANVWGTKNESCGYTCTM